jgi:hypothetical protein
MEEAKTEQDRLYFVILVVDIFRREETESSHHVSFESTRRLVGKLDTSLKDTDRDGELYTWFSR